MVKRTKSQDEQEDDNDNDLADLLAHDKMQNNKQTMSAGLAMSGGAAAAKNLNLDHVTQGKLDLMSSPSNDSTASNSPKKRNSIKAYSSAQPSSFPCGAFFSSLLRTIGNMIAVACHYYPGLCTVVLFGSVGLCLYGMARMVLNPRQDYGVMKHDHSNIKSVYDLSVGKIDHWCLRGDNDSCRCEDPLAPTSRAEHKSWQLAFKTNRKMVKTLTETSANVDVAFLGESIVEEMDGRWMGRKRKADGLDVMEQSFQQNFNKNKGASVNGVALGIAGDTSPNVLWRLMHGEMTDDFSPKVWWVTIGMNDIGRMQCSEEVVVLGILRVVEEIIQQKPDAHIVINSLFPMATLRGNMYPYLHDYKDSLGATAGSDARLQRQEEGGWIRGKRGQTTDARYATPLQVQESPPVRMEAASRNQQLGYQNRRRRRRDLRFRHKKDKGEHVKVTPAEIRARERGGTPRTAQGEGEDADAEEAMREQQAAHHKRHVFQPKKRVQDKIDTPTYYQKDKHRARPLRREEAPPPILEEQHKIRKRTRDTKLPLWTSIVVVNEQLRKFAEHNAKRVTFFDATPIFTRPSEGHRNHHHRGDGPSYELRTDLISERGHPTPLGFQIWEKVVLDKLKPILEQYNRDHPAPPPPVAVPPPIEKESSPDQDPTRFDPTFLEDDSTDEEESSADDLDGIHIDFDALRHTDDDDFEDDAFDNHMVDDEFGADLHVGRGPPAGPGPREQTTYNDNQHQQQYDDNSNAADQGDSAVNGGGRNF